MPSMSTSVDTIRSIYRLIVPEPIRRLSCIGRLKALLNHDRIERLKALLSHDLLYTSDYYDTSVGGLARTSADVIAQSIMDEFNPSSIVDVGCGAGALLAALQARGCRVVGLEYSTAALAYCRSLNLNVLRFDLRREKLPPKLRFDVATSMEVAEHLPVKSADRYVDLLIAVAPKIVFTAAPPGQGGTCHFNEQPQSYWVAKFQKRGFRFADELSRRWGEEWRASGRVESFYHQNLMIFTAADPRSDTQKAP
jgi:SAM-dependent methyltransferase